MNPRIDFTFNPTDSISAESNWSWESVVVTRGTSVDLLVDSRAGKACTGFDLLAAQDRGGEGGRECCGHHKPQ